ncbi:protein kinase superfamily protein [Actinidia rufa]|uniref:Protein kinase superfamily protein n=1 Tax=Actinidia rufa TaxID=165716 RepID=A0A7J0ESY0_9ERIC|nr:protein kinase superfamily protein [Actinidia rufa]
MTEEEQVLLLLHVWIININKGRRRENQNQLFPEYDSARPVQPPNYEKEQAYFQEVDSFELLEKSPSPKKSGTWAMGIQRDDVAIPHVSTVLKKWLFSKKLNRSSGPLGSLSRILETPALPGESICNGGIGYSGLKIPAEASLHIHSRLQTAQNKLHSSFIEKYAVGDECHEDIEVAVGKLSLTSRPDSLDGHQWDPFLALLAVCGQPTPSMQLDVFSKYCDEESIINVGDGTYGEAFAEEKAVCKIVPIDGNLRVNGEVQKGA